MVNGRHITILTALVAALICLLVFARALSCGFLNYDDMDFVQFNLEIRKLDANLISYAFTTVPTFSGIWTPLVWISFAIDYYFWELNPLGYHLTNILLHAMNTALVVFIANRLYMASSVKSVFSSCSYRFYAGVLLLAGLLYGLHPLRIESVVWISERKDVLNGFFALSSILFYLRYVQVKESSGGSESARRDYIFSVLLLLLSFMAKPISVVVPLMLLVLDWYPLNRLNRGTIRLVLIEKVPYIVLTMAMILLTLTIGASEGGMLISPELFSFGQRLITSGNAVFEYMRLMLYPVGILPIHLLTNPIPFSYTVKTVVVILICIYFCLTRERSWKLAAWLCFIIPLIPVLAFFQTNNTAYAARYTYLPSVIPSIVVAALIAAAYDKAATWRTKYYLRLWITFIVLTLIAFYVVITERLIDVWKDSDTFWTRQITYQPFDKAYFLRAGFYFNTGKYLAAVEDFTSCLDISVKEGLPKNFIVNILAYRANALAKAGLYEDAINDYSTAIEMFPRPNYFYHRAVALRELGRLKDAENDLEKAGAETGSIRWY